MTAVLELQRARAIIAGGWSESGGVRDADGRDCDPNDEGATTFSVLAALRLADAKLDVHDLLESLAVPTGPTDFLAALERAAQSGSDVDRQICIAMGEAMVRSGTTLQGWLEQRGRKLHQVLRLFDLAILRASARNNSNTTEAPHG